MILLSRQEWGARPDLPRRGHAIGRDKRTEVFIHHTVVVDNDTTGNEWETLAEVQQNMRVLQTIREADLGPDVPYSMVAFCMQDGELVLCEGRGLDRTGAHTQGHNRSALGIAFQGDFQNRPTPTHFESQLKELGDWLLDLRSNGGFSNLGKSRPGDRQVWAHRDVKATQCPGDKLFDKLDLIRFLEDDEMSMDRATWKRVQRALQALDPPLYAGKPIDGLPGRNTSIALKAFERRLELEPRGVVGAANDPEAAMWPATRELLFAETAGT